MVCMHTFTQVIAHGSDAVHGHIEAYHTLHYMLIGLCLGSRKQIYPPHLHTLEDTSIHFYSTLSLPPSLSLSLPLSLSPSLSPSLPPPLSLSPSLSTRQRTCRWCWRWLSHQLYWRQWSRASPLSLRPLPSSLPNISRY